MKIYGKIIAICNKMIIFAAEKTAKMLTLGRMNKFLCSRLTAS